ncbi:MAG: AsmA family protein [Deltaproteobacteria bacterium]|nr:AsmA family protein [Deltaproteobacteria bacterium]
MSIKTCLKIVFAVLLAAAVVAAGVAFIAPRLLDLDSRKAQILTLAQKSLNRRVSYDTASFTWHFAPAIAFRGVTIAEKSGDAAFLVAEQLSFKIALLPLLRKEVRLREIVIERPVILLDRDQDGVFNFNDLLTAKSSGSEVHLQAVRMHNGQVRFTDRLVDPKGLTTTLEKLDLYVSSLEKGETAEVRFSSLIADGSSHGQLSASGTARMPAENESLSDAKFDLRLSLKNLDVGRYWPYYGHYLPCEPLRGRLDSEQVFTGKLSEFKTKGQFKVRELSLDYPAVFHAVLAPRELTVAYEVERSPGKLAIQSFDLNVDGLHATGSCALDDLHTQDPYIKARAAIAPFRLEEFRQYIPYGVIPRGTAAFVEQKLKGGIFKLDEGRLDGRISRIAHMESGDNYKALLVRATVEKGLLSFGPQVPSFNNIKGLLEMRGKDFNLRGMTGNFGGAPFTLEGKIADYPLATPASYPFTMEITPGEAEVAWLFRQDKSSGMAFNGRSLLRLTGSGTAADYRIAGTWDLAGADYRYQQLLHKPAGIANRLRFNVRLGASEAQLTDARYELPPLDVAASAAYRYNDPASLTFALHTNRFMAGPVVAVLPGLQKYHPAGSLQAVLSGTGNPALPDAVRMKGTISLDNVSLRPVVQIKPLGSITGTIKVTEVDLQTEQLTGRVGASTFAVKGRLAGRTSPTASLVFSSPLLHPEDFGYLASGQAPEVKNVAGSVSLKQGKLTINSLSGQVNRSQFRASGEVLEAAGKQFSLRIDFPFLRMEDMAALAGLKRAGKAEEQPQDFVLQAEVTADAGSIREIPFEHLTTALSLKKKRLDMQTLRAGVFGGTVSGSGQADFAANGGPKYQTHYRLENIDADRLLRAAGVPQQLSGLLAAEGDVSGRGNTRDELLQSVRATSRLQLQNGAVTLPASAGSTGARIPYSVIDANLALQGQALTVRSLSAAIFGGTVSGSGEVNFAANGGPKYQAHYKLDHVAADQFLRAAGVQQQLSGLLAAEGDVSGRGNTLDALKHTSRGDAAIMLTDGVIHLPANGSQKSGQKLPFKNVQTRLSFGGKKLDIHSAVMEAFGGVISAKGGADYTHADGPGYRLNCQLTDINAADFYRTFDVTKDISGRMSLRAEMTASGDSAAALKKSLQGALTVHLEKGSIKKYGFISTLFSILNVSQLVDFRVPDLTSFGMPYDHIDGSFAFSSGSLSTSDLSLHSPSLNMTLVGTADLVNRSLDVKVGVQPFQTFGRIVSRIPIIGWLLTGGKKRVLVAYYEVKGKWDDPTITSVTSTALPRGVYDVFKRALNLPEELISEPGKVLLGN